MHQNNLIYEDIFQHRIEMGQVRGRTNKSNLSKEEGRTKMSESKVEKKEQDDSMMISNAEKPEQSPIIGCEMSGESEEEMEENFDMESDSFGGNMHQSKRRKKLETTEEWKRHFASLTKFQKKFGHTNIPFNDLKYRQLYHWLGRQKLRVRQDTLSKEQIDMLEKLGVDFRRTFDQKLEQISSVTDALQAEEGFKRWIGKQMDRWSRGKLPVTKVRLLKKKGFSLSMRDQFRTKKQHLGDSRKIRITHSPVIENKTRPVQISTKEIIQNVVEWDWYHECSSSLITELFEAPCFISDSEAIEELWSPARLFADQLKLISNNL